VFAGVGAIGPNSRCTASSAIAVRLDSRAGLLVDRGAGLDK